MRNVKLKLILITFMILAAVLQSASGEFPALVNLSDNSGNSGVCTVNASGSCPVENVTKVTPVNKTSNNTQECKTYNVGNCDGVIRAMYFYEPGCPNCDKAKHIIEEIESRYSNLNLTKINARDEFELCVKCATCHNVSAQVPMIVIGKYALVGYPEIKEKFEETIKTCMVGECDCIIVPNPDLNYSHLPNKNETPNTSVPKGEICLLVFMSPVCSECHTADTYIKKLEEKYPQLSVKRFYISERENYELMGKYSAKYNITPGTLAVFTGDKYFTNADDVRDKLEAEIINNAGGIQCPQPSEDSGIIELFKSFGVFAIILAGLIDGINPCAMATLIFFLSYLSIVGRKGKDILLIGFAFTFAVFLAYFLIGIGLFGFLLAAQEKIELISKLIYPIAGICAFIFFYLSVMDYFKASEGKAEDMTLQLPKSVKGMIHKIIRKQVRMRYFVIAAFTTGFSVSLFEFLCTGQVYLPTLIYIMGVPELKASAIGYLILYNLMFVVPLIAIFLAAYYGTTSQAISGIFSKNVPAIKILTALLFLLLAIFMAVLSAQMFGIL